MMRLHRDMVRALALLFLVFALPVVAHAKNEVDLLIDSGNERLRMVFIWSKPVVVQHETDGKELVLRFSAPIPPSLIAEVTDRTAAWIDWSSIGYDSLLIHAKQNVIFRVQPESDTRIAVELVSPPEIADTGVQSGQPIRQNEATALRLERLRALWLAETGKLFAARARFEQLHEQYPDNRELLPEMAGIEARLGQWQRAVTFYNQALHMGREEPSVIAAKAGLLYEYGPRLRLDMDWQQLHNADWQQISRLSGHQLFGERTQLGFAYERRSIRDNELRRVDGPLGSFRGERGYFELHAQRHFDWAAYTRLTLFGGNDAIGLGAEYSQRLDLSRVWINANYKTPEWRYVEGLVDGGTVDSLTVGWERPGRDGWRRPVDEALSTYIAASVRNYGVEDDDSVAGSYGIMLGARLLLQQIAPRLSIGYNLDLEERTSVDTRRYAGIDYHPLPVVSRQVHSLDAIWFDRLSDYLRYEAGIGASYDPRNDAGGPFVSANLAYEPWLGLEAGLKFVHSAGPYRGEYARYTRAGGYLLWRF